MIYAIEISPEDFEHQQHLWLHYLELRDAMRAAKGTKTKERLMGSVLSAYADWREYLKEARERGKVIA